MSSSVAAPVTAVIAGGIPNNVDTILASIFIALFVLVGVIYHFRIYRDYGNKFIWSVLCFDYCIARVIALSLRIAVVKNPTNKGLNVAAQITVAAGVALLWVVNLQMARRLYGQLHPHHSVPVKRFITGCIVLVVPVVAMVIFTVIQSFITRDPKILRIDRQIRLVVSVLFVILPFVPIPVVLLVLLLKAASPGGLAGPTVIITDDVEGLKTTITAAKGPNETVELQRIQTENMSGDLVGADRVTLVDEEQQRQNRPSTSLNEKEKHQQETVASVAVDADPNDNENDKNPTVSGAMATWVRALGEPESGFGPVPVGRTEILKSAAVIVVPAALLTLEQCVRCAQGFYVHKPGNPTPWFMSKATFWIFIFGMEIVAILVLGLAALPRRFSHLKLI
ncbi:hypothetical protein FRC17_001873 [Serendipita sp. 399]|nr:hypothetical protein FRC17_001873 [Serendipita sp. 399]